jgi:hypothetical protein
MNEPPQPPEQDESQQPSLQQSSQLPSRREQARVSDSDVREQQPLRGQRLRDDRPERQGRRGRRQRDETPSGPLPPREPRAVRGQSGGEVSLKTIGIIAFIFGVFLHGCVAWSVLEDEGLPTEDDLPVVVATSTPVTQGTVVPTALPDRTTCDEIRGTEYRSEAERDFFRRNCITSIAPIAPGSGPALGQTRGLAG